MGFNPKIVYLGIKEGAMIDWVVHYFPMNKIQKYNRLNAETYDFTRFCTT
jgi:hypothetical protein